MSTTVDELLASARAGIIGLAAQIPGVAQGCFIFSSPTLAGEDGGIGERQAMPPKHAERVLAAGDGVDGGERGAG